MTNQNTPFGLQPCDAGGRPWEGALNMYYVPAADATALYLGDPVALTSLGESGVQGVTRCASGGTPIGVFMGVAKPLNAHGKIYREASVETWILVADDPDQFFLAQEDSVGGNIPEYRVGSNVDVSVGGGSTVTGRSVALLDSSSVTASSTPSFKIVGLAPIVGNEIGDYAKWIVKPNLHARAHSTLGVGD
jgi:hypothetical protein